jgi:DNA topoisomerase VI subunit A
VGFTKNMVKQKELEKSPELEQMDPWSLYIYAMKAPMTRDRYQIRLAKFLAFIGLAGNTVQEQSKAFAKKGKDDSIWALNSVLKFVQFQKDRVEKRDIWCHSQELYKEYQIIL